MIGVRAKGRRVAAGHLECARDDYSLRQEHKIRGKGGYKTRGEGGCSCVFIGERREDGQGRG